VDGGTWEAPPVNVTGDGTHTVDCQALDNAGNVSTWSDTVKVDTTPPVSAFHEPAEGATVWGVVTLQGESNDPTSGPAAVEVSTDGGQTWKPATLVSSTARWTAFWDTRPLPDGEYTLLARAKDEAGNEEHTAIVHVTVANAPPEIHLMPASWYFWQTAQAKIIPNPYIPLKAVTVKVLGPPGRIREWRYGAAQSVDIKWDGRWYSENGEWAHPGTYRVVVKAEDIYGHGSQTEGEVIVPAQAATSTPTPTPTATSTPTPTWTPTPTATEASAPQPRPTRAQVVALPTSTPRAVAPPTSKPAIKQREGVTKFQLHAVLLAGALALLSGVLVLDPRPRPTEGLADTIRRITDFMEKR